MLHSHPGPRRNDRTTLDSDRGSASLPEGRSRHHAATLAHGDGQLGTPSDPPDRLGATQTPRPDHNRPRLPPWKPSRTGCTDCPPDSLQTFMKFVDKQTGALNFGGHRDHEQARGMGYLCRKFLCGYNGCSGVSNDGCSGFHCDDCFAVRTSAVCPDMLDSSIGACQQGGPDVHFGFYHPRYVPDNFVPFQPAVSTTGSQASMLATVIPPSSAQPVQPLIPASGDHSSNADRAAHLAPALAASALDGPAPMPVDEPTAEDLACQAAGRLAMETYADVCIRASAASTDSLSVYRPLVESLRHCATLGSAWNSLSRSADSIQHQYRVVTHLSELEVIVAFLENPLDLRDLRTAYHDRASGARISDLISARAAERFEFESKEHILQHIYGKVTPTPVEPLPDSWCTRGLQAPLLSYVVPFQTEQHLVGYPYGLNHLKPYTPWAKLLSKEGPSFFNSDSSVADEYLHLLPWGKNNSQDSRAFSINIAAWPEGGGQHISLKDAPEETLLEEEDS